MVAIYTEGNHTLFFSRQSFAHRKVNEVRNREKQEVDKKKKPFCFIFSSFLCQIKNILLFLQQNLIM